MDEFNNPFTPGAGSPPPELAGRETVLKNANLALQRVMKGRHAKSFVLIGLRGVGKTVLLNEISNRADGIGFQTISIEAHDNKTLPELLVPELRRVLLALDRMGQTSDAVKRGLSVLLSFLGKVSLKYGDLELGLDVKPETGVGDTGDLEVDLASLIIALGEAAVARSTSVSIFIDELQYLNETELSAIIMAMHRVSQKQLPILLIGAGLPQLVGQIGESKSYTERLFDFPRIEQLKPKDAKKAIVDPINANSAKITNQAVQEIIVVTKGYPYFIQEWGHHAWDLAKGSSITLTDAKAATEKAIASLDQSFFRVRFDRLTPRERDYLRAMAELGEGPHRSGDIADALGVKSDSVAPLRSGLIRKGMVFSPQYGDTAFTVPLFDQYMKRVMPDMPKRRSAK